ncbi:MAG: cytochrome P450 [Gammaproteobacteria bacterium]|jgi:cytochrome P450
MKTYARDYTNDYDLDDPELSDNWDDIVADLHARCPIARSEAGEGYWVLNGHDDVSRCAKDWRTFTSRDGFIVNRPPGMPYFAPAEIDPPVQRGLRRVLEPFLRQQTVADLEPIVRQHANALIDGFIADGRVEAVSAFANPLPQIVFSSAVAGMDPATMPELLDDFSFVAPPVERAQGFQRGMQRIEAYLSERRDEPARGDIVDALLAFEHPEFNWMDKVGTLCQLTIGGIGTTGFVFSGGLHHLATHCDDRQRLVAEPASIPSAIEEFLRLYPGVANMARSVAQDCDVNGQAFKRGDRVLLSFSAACRDPALVDEPNLVKIDRGKINHLAFGAGVHRCIGEWLARVVLKSGYETFLERIPEFHVADNFVPRYETGNTRHMVELPLEFTR